MELKARLEFCNKCEHKLFDFKTGVLCGLTQRKPDFEDSCKDFKTSDLEKQKVNAKEYTKKLNNEANTFSEEIVNSNKNKLKSDGAAFLKELKESESSNSVQNNDSQTPGWRIALGIIIFIVALIRLIMIFV